jgi:hypothetical protein
MSYLIISYEVINGSKTESRPKGKPVKTLDQIDNLQKRAERIWNQGVDEQHRGSVYINYVNLGKHNPKSENLGKHNFKLDKWM